MADKVSTVTTEPSVTQQVPTDDFTAVEAIVNATVEECFNVWIDVESYTKWLPDLESVLVIQRYSDGMPLRVRTTLPSGHVSIDVYNTRNAPSEVHSWMVDPKTDQSYFEVLVRFEQVLPQRGIDQTKVTYQFRFVTPPTDDRPKNLELLKLATARRLKVFANRVIAVAAIEKLTDSGTISATMNPSQSPSAIEPFELFSSIESSKPADILVDELRTSLDKIADERDELQRRLDELEQREIAVVHQTMEAGRLSWAGLARAFNMYPSSFQRRYDPAYRDRSRKATRRSNQQRNDDLRRYRELSSDDDGSTESA